MSCVSGEVHPLYFLRAKTVARSLDYALDRLRHCNHEISFVGLLPPNAMVERQLWKSKTATRLSGGGLPGPEQTGRISYTILPQQALYFPPLPHGHGAFLFGFVPFSIIN